MEKNYSKPVISRSNPADWFLHVRYFHGGKWHQRKYREGLNRISDLKERLRQFKVLAEVREEWLEAGWNPIMDPDFKSRNAIQAQEIKQMGFSEAMRFALDKKRPDLAKKSYQDYDNVITIAIDYADEAGLNSMPVDSIKRIHILDLLQRLFTGRKMSNHRYNIYLGVIRALFSTLEEWQICEYNPATKITKKVVAESSKYASYTDAEKIKIADHLKIRHPQLLSFLQVIYHTGIRPKEILSLQVKDIDLVRRVISIEPDLERENSKTVFLRYVPISNVLFPFLKAMCLDQYPSEFYVFGSPFTPGEGNRGAGSEKWGRKHRLGLGKVTGRSGAMRSDYLTPMPFAARRDTVTNLWKVLIKDELEINKCLYAGKHTGADDKIMAGIDLDALRNLYGHRSKYMTTIYAKSITEVYNSEIRTKAKEFTGGAKVRRIA